MNRHNQLLALILFSFFVCINSCKKAEEETSVQLPVITTLPVGDVTRSSAIFKAKLSSKGDEDFTIGFVQFCFSEKPNPTVKDSLTYGDRLNDSICSSPKVTLKFNKTYHVRAYADKGGIIYGNDVTFTTKNPAIKFNEGLTYGTLTDIDGNNYKTIQIGSKIWMAENLKVTHFNNGDIIPNITDPVTWKDLTGPAYCYYDNDSLNNEIYGKLYKGFTVMDVRNIAPVGWHIPTKYELEQLMAYDIRGLIETGNLHWERPSPSQNYTGFSAIPGGSGGTNFGLIGFGCYFWSKTGYNDSIGGLELFVLSIYCYYPDDYIIKVRSSFKNIYGGSSIRCVKD